MLEQKLAVGVGTDENITHVPLESFEAMIKKVAADYPNFLAIATTLRAVKKRDDQRLDRGALARGRVSFVAGVRGAGDHGPRGRRG